MTRDRLTGVPRRGSQRWLRPTLYLLALVAVQSLLSRLAEAVGVAAPDLFLLTGAALAWRLAPLPALLAAYGVGMLQDVLGAGTLGFHAAGVAGGALLVMFVRRYVGDGSIFQGLLSVVAAVVGEWLAFLVLNYVLRMGLITQASMIQTVPAVFLGTLIVSVVWERLIVWGLGERSGSEENFS